MPEGDTVWNTAATLQRALAGTTLTGSDFRVPQLAIADLSGWVVHESACRGKHLLLRLTGPGGERRTLHSHLRMDGAWRAYAKRQRWAARPGHLIRVVLRTASADAVGYHLHELALLPTEREHELVGHLGPDLMGRDWDPDEAVRRLAEHPDEPIGEALLDQRNLAGIGTFYRAELLFLQGIHPRTPVREVGNLRRVVQRGQQLLYANRWRVEQSTTGDLRAGRRAYVFERPGQPCRRCGTPIRTEEFGTVGQERRSYWCPRCQPQR